MMNVLDLKSNNEQYFFFYYSKNLSNVSVISFIQYVIQRVMYPLIR